MAVEPTLLDSYEIVLADLRARREQLDQAITALEAIRPGTLSTPAQSAQNSAQVDAVDSPGAFLGMTIVEAAKAVLQSRRQTMRNPELVLVFRAGGLVLNSNDPVNTIGAVLTRRFNDVGDIVKVDRGTWGLKEWYPNRSFKREKPETSESKPQASASAGIAETSHSDDTDQS